MRALCLSLLTIPSLATAAEVKIVNGVPFDVDVCFPPTAATKVDTELALNGVVAMASPAVAECLLPPASHGPGAATSATLVWTLDGKGLSVKVDKQDNVTDAGVACLGKLATRVKLEPRPAGAPPLTARTEHQLGADDLLKLGVNAPSDVNAAIRVALPSWCACYDGYATTVPPVLGAKITLAAGKDRAEKVEFDAAPDAARLSSCLRDKLLALPIPPATGAVTFPRRFIHMHSGATDGGSLPVELAFFQLQRVRARRGAAMAVAVGAVDAPQERLNAAAAAYVKNKGKAADLARVREGCTTLAAAQDAAIASAERILATDDALLALKLAPDWAAALEDVKKQRAEDADHLARFKEERANTARGCK